MSKTIEIVDGEVEVKWLSLKRALRVAKVNFARIQKKKLVKKRTVRSTLTIVF